MNKLLLFLLTATCFYTNAQTILYKGFLGENKIQLAIHAFDDAFDALYIYDKHDTSIEVNGILKSKKLSLFEKNKKDTIAVLEFNNFNRSNTSISGKWISRKENLILPIKLEKEYQFDSYDSSKFSARELPQLESTKNHYFKLILSKEKKERARVYGIKIFEKGSDKLLQKIPLDCSYIGLQNTFVGDYNFDKIDDIAVFEASYAGSNTSSVYILRNPKKQSYFLSNYKGTSLEFDYETQTVHEYNQCCAGRSHTTNIYKIVNNKMILVKRESFELEGVEDEN